MLNKILLGCVIVAILTLISFLAIEYWPITIIRANQQPYKVLTKKVKIGSQLVYVVDACKYVKATAAVSRAYVDGLRYPSIESLDNIVVGCKKTNVSVLIPNYIVPGTYHLELNVRYRINALRTDSYQFLTEDFEVVK